MVKWVVTFIMFLCLLSAIVAFFVTSRLVSQQGAAISSYDACVKAGYPVLESYPPVCKTPNGKSFTQDIGNELKYKDEIIVTSPRPNQKITSPLEITGKARGSWFFEAQFSAELVDKNNKSLGKTILKANGNWMTTDFVPFVGSLSFTIGSLEKATLILRNDNPSGLPEKQKELLIPVSL